MRELLDENIRVLQKQLSWLEISYKECSSIKIKEEFSVDELVHLFDDLLKYTPKLMEFISSSLDYAKGIK